MATSGKTESIGVEGILSMLMSKIIDLEVRFHTQVPDVSRINENFVNLQRECAELREALSRLSPPPAEASPGAGLTPVNKPTARENWMRNLFGGESSDSSDGSGGSAF